MRKKTIIDVSTGKATTRKYTAAENAARDAFEAISDKVTIRERPASAALRLLAQDANPGRKAQILALLDKT